MKLSKITEDVVKREKYVQEIEALLNCYCSDNDKFECVDIKEGFELFWDECDFKNERILRKDFYTKYILFCEKRDLLFCTKNKFYDFVRKKGVRELKTGGYIFFCI